MILVGLDVGTTGTRASAYRADGTLVVDASRAVGFDAPRPGFAEVPPERWWDALADALREVTAALARLGERPSAVAVAGQAPTLALVDARFASVRPAILWLDVRAEAEAHALGVPSYYLGPKLAWLARHEPRAFDGAAHVLDSASYVGAKLTGVAAAEPSTAALALPFVRRGEGPRGEGCFDDAALAGAGVRPSLVPELRPSAALLGTVSAEAAGATGLPAGTPVAAGAADFAAATLGAGVLDPGEACLVLGTAGNLLAPLAAPGRDARLIQSVHAAPGRHLALGGTLCGGALEASRSLLGSPSYEDLERAAAAVPAGAEGLVVLPAFTGERTPTWRSDARAAFVGLGLHHGPGHVHRATLEAVAVALLDALSIVEAERGAPIARVVAANGAGKSALFRQILADALGAELTWIGATGGTTWGAAVLGGLAAGLLPGPEAARAGVRAAAVHAPDPRLRGLYDARLAERRALGEALAPTHARLARAT